MRKIRREEVSHIITYYVKESTMTMISMKYAASTANSKKERKATRNALVYLRICFFDVDCFEVRTPSKMTVVDTQVSYRICFRSDFFSYNYNPHPHLV